MAVTGLSFREILTPRDDEFVHLKGKVLGFRDVTREPGRDGGLMYVDTTAFRGVTVFVWCDSACGVIVSVWCDSVCVV